MRSEQEMMDLILNTAKEDDRIRAVIMNGSRTNPKVKKDCFQDFDIVYVVRAIQSFTSDHRWVQRFGEMMIMQMPEAMVLIPPEDDGRFIYLMQFTDGNRIDLSLVPVEKRDQLISRDSLSILLLDKDNAIEPFPPPNDTDYLIEPPTAKQFANCCNEFWWVSTYVAKALWREELPYAKAMQDDPVRTMLIQMLVWHVGVKTQFTVSAGKNGKYLQRYLDKPLWTQFVQTYSDAGYENMWQSLFTMGSLFRTVAMQVAEYYGYDYPIGDDERVTAHLKHVQALDKDAQEIY